MDGMFPDIFHGERSELREKYGLATYTEQTNAMLTAF
jgi:hypothetical protein